MTISLAFFASADKALDVSVAKSLATFSTEVLTVCVSVLNSLITVARVFPSCVIFSEVPPAYKALPFFCSKLFSPTNSLTSADSLSGPVPNCSTLVSSTTLLGSELSITHSLIKLPTGILTTRLVPSSNLKVITMASWSGSYLASSITVDNPITCCPTIASLTLMVKIPFS